MPLMWAHAEYVKLLRSTADGKVYDLIPEVAARYLGARPTTRKRFEVWNPNRQVRFMKRGEILRVLGMAPFTLHWAADDWKTVEDTKSIRTALGVDYVDIPSTIAKSGTCFHFTFLWMETNKWEGQDFAVTVA